MTGARREGLFWWKERYKVVASTSPKTFDNNFQHLQSKKIEIINLYHNHSNNMTAKQLASSGLSLPNDTYIYSLARTTTSCAAISSDDSLRYFDPTNLSLVHTVAKAHQGITCLKATSDGKGLVTAGRDGTVRCWDERAKSAGVQMADRRFFLFLISSVLPRFL